MKKLLILVMVLAMASLANATLIGINIDGTTTAIVDGTDVVVQINAGEDYTVSLLGDTAGGLEYFDLARTSETEMATLTLPTMVAPVGSLSGVVDFSTTALFDYELTTGDGTGVYPGGILFESTMTASDTLGTFELLILAGDDYRTLYTARFEIVPEPMTIALLGLGGLLLRRRMA